MPRKQRTVVRPNTPPTPAVVAEATAARSKRLIDLHEGTLRKHKGIYKRFGQQIDEIALAPAFDSIKADRTNRSTLLGLFAHAHAEGWPTATDDLLVGDYIDKFCDTLSLGTGSTFRTRLNRLAEAVTGTPITSSDRVKFPRHALRRPHTPTEREAFYVAAKTITNRNGRRRDAYMLLDLTFEAGCSPASAYNATESWIVWDRRGAWLYDPERNQPIYLRPAVARRFRGATTGDPKRLLLNPDGTGGTRQVARVVERLRAASPAFNDFAAGRARSRWRVDILDKVGFAVIADMLVAQPDHRTILDLMAFMAPVSDGQAKEVTRRAVGR